MNAITSNTLPTVTLTAEAFGALSTKQIVALGAICVIAVTDGNAPAKPSKASKAGKTTAEAAVTGVPATRLNAAGRVVDATTGKFVKVPEGRVNTPKGKAGKPARKAKKTAAQKAKAAKREEFVGWLKDSAEARKARQKSNSEMASWMRAQGLQPRGAAWELAKHGERSVTVLAKAQRKEAKAAKKAKQA